MPVTTDLRLGALDRAAEAAFREVVADVAQQAHDLFDDPVWGWPTSTRRRDGSVAGTVRDVVDSGHLQASQQPPEVDGLNARLTWDAGYAAAVFLGAVFRKRSGSLPARNVPLAALRTVNLSERWALHLRAHL